MNSSSLSRQKRMRSRIQCGSYLSHTSQIVKPVNTRYKTPRIKSISNTQTQISKSSKSCDVIAPAQNTIDQNYIHLKESVSKGKHINDICSICHEKLGGDDVAITSCYHLFHYNCLIAFRELSLPTKQKCPKCKSTYSFEPIKMDKVFLNASAVKIQKVVRGYLLRRKLEYILPQDCDIYNKIISKKAKENSAKLVDVVENQSDAVDAILMSINQELEWSRSLMKAIEVKEKNIDWDSIRKEIKSKGIGVCSICLREIKPSECTITSCKHCFHTKCLDQWTCYCSKNEKMQNTCPVCRSFFQKEKYIAHKREFELPKLVEDSYAFHII